MPVVMSEISTKISISIKDMLINTYRNMYSTTQETYFLLIFLSHSIIFLIPSLSQNKGLGLRPLHTASYVFSNESLETVGWLIMASIIQTAKEPTFRL